jgi:hypothetical protein
VIVSLVFDTHREAWIVQINDYFIICTHRFTDRPETLFSINQERDHNLAELVFPFFQSVEKGPVTSESASLLLLGHRAEGYSSAVVTFDDIGIHIDGVLLPKSSSDVENLATLVSENSDRFAIKITSSEVDSSNWTFHLRETGPHTQQFLAKMIGKTTVGRIPFRFQVLWPPIETGFDVANSKS